MINKFASILVFSSLLSSSSLWAQYNALDPTYKSYFGTISEVRSVAVQPDGKIVAVGVFTYYTKTIGANIVRINTDGTLDPTFSAGTGTDKRINDVAIQPDGKIVIGGIFQTYNGVACNGAARLNADGSLDATFQPGTAAGDEIKKVVIHPNGKIYLGGSLSFATTSKALNRGVVRLLSTGAIDQTFSPGIQLASVFSFDVQSDGKVVASGILNTASSFVRLNLDGTLDNTFLNDPTLTKLYMTQILVQPNGKMIVAGYFTSYKGVTRNHIALLNADGTLDTSFDPSAGFDSGTFYDLALQSDGKLLVVGNFDSYNGTSSKRVVRLNPNGTLDGSFKMPSYSDVFTAYVYADGKILVGGNATNYLGFSNTGGIVRLLPCLGPAEPINTTVQTSVCSGKEITLSVASTSNTIKWYTSRTGGTLVGQGTSIKIIPTNSIYYAEASNACAINPTRTSVEFETKSVPKVYITPSATSVCKGEAVTLKQGTSSIPGPIAISFEWKGGVVNEKPFVPTQTTVYTLVGTGESGCTTEVNVTISVLDKPVVLTTASATSICSGSEVILSAIGAYSYAWSGGVQNRVPFSPTSDALYTVVGVLPNGCKDTAEVSVQVKPKPNIGTTIVGNTIKANQAGASYQWLNCTNGNTAVTNQTGQTFTPNNAQPYAVEVTLAGCVDTSACVKAQFSTDLETEEAKSRADVRISPNPSNGVFTVTSPYVGDFLLLNELGQTIQQLRLAAGTSQTIQWEEVKSGVYYLVSSPDSLVPSRHKLIISK